MTQTSYESILDFVRTGNPDVATTVLTARILTGTPAQLPGQQLWLGIWTSWRSFLFTRKARKIPSSAVRSI